MHCISEAVREKCAVILASAHFMSLLSDGSQARKIGREKELVLVKTERNGIPTYIVASLLEVADFGGADANSITKGLNSVFEKGDSFFKMDKEDYRNKLVSCIADGASVNFGIYNGILPQMQATRPWLLKIHCVNHRVELAVKDVFTKIPQFQKVDNFYIANFYLLRNCGKLKEQVRESSKALGIDFKNLSKIKGTRFIGHHREGLRKLLDSWPAFLTAYENYVITNKNKKTNAKVSGLLKKFKSYDFLATVATYLDMLELVVPASKIFERNELMPHEIPGTIESTLLIMNEALEGIGSEDEFLDSSLKRFRPSVIETELVGNYPKAGDKRKKEQNRIYFDLKLSLNKVNVSAAERKAQRLKRKVIPRLMNTIRSRFIDYDVQRDLYDVMKFIDKEYWSSEIGFGNEEITFLSEHFSIPLRYSGFCEKKCLKEWKKFKIHVQSHLNKLNIRDMLKSTLCYKREAFPNLSILISLIKHFGIKL